VGLHSAEQVENRLSIYVENHHEISCLPTNNGVQPILKIKKKKKRVPVNCYLPVPVHKIPSNRHFHETQNQITRIKAQGHKRPSGLAKAGHKASN